MIRISNLYKSFASRPVLNGVDVSVPAGSIIGLIGPSGGGKSVLLKIIAGVYPPDKGEVEFESQERPRISLMFQEGALFDSFNVFDNVAFPLVDGRVPASTLDKDTLNSVGKEVFHILDEVGLVKAVYKMPGQLSGGMRRRVSLARALVCKPQLALLDDPTAGLDPVASSVIMDLIVKLHHEYRPTTIVVSHDLRRLLPVVDLVLALFDGQIRFFGGFRDLRDSSPDEVKNFVSCRFDFVHQSSSISV